ncbi:hypothetical protein MCEMIHM21_01190 [Candidatus Pelagibacterales bacterium]|jgi:hypothetical protein
MLKIKEFLRKLEIERNSLNKIELIKKLLIELKNLEKSEINKINNKIKD